MKRLSVTGPESTGKSALAQWLAAKMDTIYVPEIARDYLQELNRPYQEEDLVKIAMLQCAAEDQAALMKPEVLICDTDMLVIRIWSEVRYGRVHPFILDQYRRRKYDLTLLMQTDLPWEEDPLREHPDRRTELFERYHERLAQDKVAFEIISGEGADRNAAALKAIRDHGLFHGD